VQQKILSFCLKHWKEIGLVLLLFVVFAKSRHDMSNIIKANELTEAALKDQIETLQALHADELRMRDEALEKYRKDMEELERRYNERQTEIVYLTKEEKETIIKEFKQDKALIIKRFEEAYGLRYVE